MKAVKGSYIPCKTVRVLREYTRYRYKLVSCRSSEKNRYQNALTVCNVALDSVVSDIFGKSSTSIIDYLLEQSGTSINHEEIASKLLRSLRSKEDTVIESIEGYQMTDAPKYRMHLVRAHMDYITAEINDVDSMIEKLISSDSDYENAVQFLCTIYQMLSTGELWNPSNLYKIDMPAAFVEKQTAKAIKQAKKLLQREGLLPPDEPLAS